MLKVGKIVVYDGWNGIINSDSNDYIFRRNDIKGEVVEGDIVDFVPEEYPHENSYVEKKMTARFVKKKELFHQ